jgi:hypothetical protein
LAPNAAIDGLGETHYVPQAPIFLLYEEGWYRGIRGGVKHVLAPFQQELIHTRNNLNHNGDASFIAFSHCR